MTTPTRNEAVLYARYEPDWGCMMLCNRDHYGAVEYRLASAAASGDVVEDAERWRALMSSQRMHMMGSFGFDYVFDPPDSKKTTDLVDVIPRTGDYMHFGIEFWSEHSAFGDPKWPDTFPRKVLTTYVDEMRRRAAMSQSTPVVGEQERTVRDQDARIKALEDRYEDWRPVSEQPHHIQIERGELFSFYRDDEDGTYWSGTWSQRRDADIWCRVVTAGLNGRAHSILEKGKKADA